MRLTQESNRGKKCLSGGRRESCTACSHILKAAMRKILLVLLVLLVCCRLSNKFCNVHTQCCRATAGKRTPRWAKIVIYKRKNLKKKWNTKRKIFCLAALCLQGLLSLDIFRSVAVVSLFARRRLTARDTGGCRRPAGSRFVLVPMQCKTATCRGEIRSPIVPLKRCFNDGLLTKAPLTQFSGSASNLPSSFTRIQRRALLIAAPAFFSFHTLTCFPTMQICNLVSTGVCLGS